MRVPLDGGTLIELASGQDGAQSIAVDSTHVYFTSRNDGTVMKIHK